MHKPRSASTQSPLDNTYYLLHHMSFILDKEFDVLLKEQINIGLSQFKILAVLEAWPYSQQRSIAKILGQDESGVSRQIAGLVQSGLVGKEAHPSDGRQQLIVLTAKGADVVSKAQDLRESISHRVLSVLSPAQRQDFHRTLQQLHQRACTPESGCEQYIR